MSFLLRRPDLRAHLLSSSVSREYGAVPLPAPSADAKRGMKRAGGRGRGGKGQGSVTVRRVGSLKKLKSGLQPLCVEGVRVVTEETPLGDPKEIGTPDAPIWNHVAQL